MSQRWLILAVLFFARMTMAFQFQSVAAVSPIIVSDFGVNLGDLGLLIGLYLAPGVVVAIPGGAIASRFGEKRIVAIGMLMMLIGSALTLVSPTWEVTVAGRLLAGAGGVILNIVMTKMVVDWFAGREIATAMAVFINSWPVGIAFALLVLPSAAIAGGLVTAWWITTGIIASGLLAFLCLYKAPAGKKTALTGVKVAKLPVYPLLLAGLIWALYNTALAMVFSFSPALLSEMGWTLESAGSVTSTFMIVFSIAVPLGGILADRTGRGDAVILTSLIGFTVLMPLTSLVSPLGVIAIFVVVGVLFALGAGPIMALPSQVLSAEARTFGMGVFFTIYYGVMMVAPKIAGMLADWSGQASWAIYFGSLMSAVCIVSLVLFRFAHPNVVKADANSPEA
jgi:MFS family permease